MIAGGGLTHRIKSLSAISLGASRHPDGSSPWR